VGVVTAPTLERLRALPLFAGLGNETLGRLADAAAELELRPGQVVIQANEPGSGLFVLEAGEVTVELRGGTVPLGPGEFFGELSLLVPDAPRTARVRATAPGRCLAIGRAEFAAALESDPALALAMLRVLARRLIDTSAQA